MKLGFMLRGFLSLFARVTFVAAALVLFSMPQPAAAAATFTFGGNGYCTYQGTINLDSFQIIYNADNSVSAAPMQVTYTESIVGTCPFAPLDVQHWTFSLSKATFYSNRLRVDLVGSSGNTPQTIAYYDGVFANKNTNGTVTFQRADNTAPPVMWTVNVPWSGVYTP